MKTGRHAVIILAAGFSRRMKQFKPLLTLDGETITDRVIATFLANGIDVFLVVGYRQDELRASIKEWNITIVDNPDYRQGMFSSVQAGISRLSLAHQAFFVMPADIPMVRPATIRQLLDVAEEHPDKIIFPVFGKRRGHPPLIPVSMVPTIMGWERGGGLRAVLYPQVELILEVPVTDSNILFDIDTMEDYLALLERFHHHEASMDGECARQD